jgi:uncharacterized protein (DUF1778 family)
MRTAESKNARVDFRLRSEQKEIISRAAALAGLSVSDFISSVVLKASMEVLETHSQVIALPYDAWERFSEAIQAEVQEPTEASRKAAARYRKGRVSGDTYQW